MPRTRFGRILCAVLVLVILGVGMGLQSLRAGRYKPVMTWAAAKDGTVLVYRDVARTGLKPDWETVYKVLPQEARGQTFETVLLGVVPGAVDGRLVLQTKTGWVMFVQLGDVTKDRRQAFANAAVVYSAALIEGQPREVAVKRVMTMAATPASFR